MASSIAYDVAKNSRPLSDVAAALVDQGPLIRMIPLAIAEVQQQLAPAELEPLVGTLTESLTLVAPHLAEQQIGLWLEAAVRALEPWPGDLVMAAAVEARTSTRHAAQIVPNIVDAIRDTAASRQKRLDAFERMLAASTATPDALAHSAG